MPDEKDLDKDKLGQTQEKQDPVKNEEAEGHGSEAGGDDGEGRTGTKKGSTDS